jgi:hypothetical protein
MPSLQLAENHTIRDATLHRIVPNPIAAHHRTSGSVQQILSAMLPHGG